MLAPEGQPSSPILVESVLTLEAWDVYAVYAVIDRGELGKPETTLPNLDGGFDQRQLVVGVRYRHDPKPR